MGSVSPLISITLWETRQLLPGVNLYPRPVPDDNTFYRGFDSDRDHTRDAHCLYFTENWTRDTEVGRRNDQRGNGRSLRAVAARYSI